MKLFLSILGLTFLCQLTALAQTNFPLEEQNPWLANPTLDVESYDLRLSVTSVAAPQLMARLRIKLKTLKMLTSIKLHTDAQRLAIQSVTLNSTAVSFRTLSGVPGQYNLTGDVLEILPLTPVSPHLQQVLDIKYLLKVNQPTATSAAVDEGFFYHADFNGTPVLSTRSWPYYTRTWMPSHDHPNDAAKFSVSATVPEEYQLLSNGELVSTKFTPQGIRYRWQINVAIPTYDMSVVIGKFTEHNRSICFNLSAASSDQTTDCAQATTKIPATFYIPNNHPSTPQFLASFDKSNKSLVWFANILGEYEYPKSGIVVSPHPFSMEHAGLITLINPRSAVHEVAHHWWGNTVHIAHWGDFWSSEGFTTYMDGLYEEYLTGSDTSCRQTTGVLNTTADTDPMTIFDSTAYCKGAAALHGLRETIAALVGLPVSDPQVRHFMYLTLRAIYREYRFKKLGTETLLAFIDAQLPALLNLEATMVQTALQSWKAQWFAL